jgi:hypothetical protein
MRRCVVPETRGRRCVLLFPFFLLSDSRPLFKLSPTLTSSNLQQSFDLLRFIRGPEGASSDAAHRRAFDLKRLLEVCPPYFSTLLLLTFCSVGSEQSLPSLPLVTLPHPLDPRPTRQRRTRRFPGESWDSDYGFEGQGQGEVGGLCGRGGLVATRRRVAADVVELSELERGGKGRETEARDEGGGDNKRTSDATDQR